MRSCKDCGITNYEHYPNLSQRCKNCMKAYWRKWEKSSERKTYRKVWDNLPQVKSKKSLRQRDYYPKWYKRNGRKKSQASDESSLRWQKENRKGVKAQAKLRYAVRTGKIKKPDLCSHCYRKAKISGHHEDYDKPLEVIWFCYSCHKRHHTYKNLLCRLDSSSNLMLHK